MSILDTLHSIDSTIDSDDCFILAAAINIYSESLRRRQGRILYHGADVKALFTIMQTLTGHKPTEPLSPSRASAPNPAEEEQIVDVHKAIEEMATGNGRRI